MASSTDTSFRETCEDLCVGQRQWRLADLFGFGWRRRFAPRSCWRLARWRSSQSPNTGCGSAPDLKSPLGSLSPFLAGVCRERFDIALRRRVPAVENPCARARPLLRRGDGRSSRARGDHLLGWTSAFLDDLRYLRRRGGLHVFACASVGPARSGGSAGQCLAARPLCRDELHSLRLHSGFFQISNLRPLRPNLPPHRRR